MNDILIANRGRCLTRVQFEVEVFMFRSRTFSPLYLNNLTRLFLRSLLQGLIITILLSGLAHSFSQQAASRSAASTIKVIGTNESNYPNAKVPRFMRFEITFEVAGDYSNPYDFGQILVDGYFTAPETGHIVRQPGFFYQEYAVSGVNAAQPEIAVEQHTAVGNPVWKIRFSPREVGTYKLQITAKVRGINANPVWLTFDAVESDLPGFIERDDGLDPNYSYFHYFKFSRGDPFLGLGMNLGWWETDTQAISTYEYYLNRMHANNANVARVWMTNSVREAPASPKLTADKILSLQDTTLGSNYNQLDAWNFDRILEIAEQRGIYFILTLEDSHQFTAAKRIIDPPQMWENHNLYNLANGGVLTDRYDIFDNEQAIKHQQSVFRYVIARWGYSTSIMSWELFNEIDEFVNSIEDPVTKQTEWALMRTWHSEMASFFNEHDAHQHMVDTSTGSFNPTFNPQSDISNYTSLYAPLSFAQMHFYYTEGRKSNSQPSDPEGRDMAYLAWYYTSNSLSIYPEKPVVIGEFGLTKDLGEGRDWGHTDWLEWDDRGTHLHNGLWSSLMSGGALAGMHWHWHNFWLPDYAWWRHYASIGNFIDGIQVRSLKPLNPPHMTPVLSLNQPYAAPEGLVCSDALCSDDPFLRVMGLRDEAATYLWVQNSKNTWWNYTHDWQWDCGKGNHESDLLVNGYITVTGLLSNAPYYIEWWDPYQVDPQYQIYQNTVEPTLPSGDLKIHITGLKEDIALKIRPAAAALDVVRSAGETVVSAGNKVPITTTVWNRGNTPLNVTIIDSDCGDQNPGTISPGGSYPYECWMTVDRDMESAAVAAGATPTGSVVTAADRVFISVPDGVVGSGSSESCTESALRADLFGYSGSTIGFDCGPRDYYYPIYLSEPLTISRQITITRDPMVISATLSTPGSNIILSGGHSNRVFDVQKPGHLTLSGLRISAGAAHGCTIGTEDNQGGGGLDVGGKATASVNNTRFFGNSGDFGGAVHVHFAGNLFLNASKLWINRAEVPFTITATDAVSSTLISDGGALYSEGNFIISGNTQIWNNSARYGGGIYTKGTGEIYASQIFAHTDIDSGGGIVNLNGSLHIEDSKIYGNSVKTNGGGVTNSGWGRLTIIETEISSNTAAHNGGGIALYDSAALTVTKSLFAGNSASWAGGAIANLTQPDPAANILHTLLNVTFSKNRAETKENGEIVVLGTGGGIYTGPGAAEMRLQSNTFKENSAYTGGGLATDGLPVFFHNTIMAGNTAASSPATVDCARIGGLVFSQGYNLIGVRDSCFSNSTDLKEGDKMGSEKFPLDPGLASLARNGGPTSTYALLPYSLALDAGDMQLWPDTDQRGAARPQGDRCDIGAFEMVQLSIADAAGEESISETKSIQFLVSLPGTTVQEVSVTYKTMDGTAKGCDLSFCSEGYDYVSTSGTLIFPVGTQSLTITVTVLPDSIPEPDEHFFINLSTSTNALIFDAEAIGTILDGGGGNNILRVIFLPLILDK